MTTLLLQGNVLDVIKNLPNDLFHCVVTSPPYWGIRRYKGEQEIVWGGDGECKHEWEMVKAVRQSAPGDKPGLNSSIASGRTVNENRPGQPGNVCSLCGAWKGAYGLEPDPSMYVQHTVEILREIKRVLREDGVVFWNIGDSYAGGEGQSGNRGAEYQDARHQSGESLNTAYQTLGGAKQTRPIDDRKALRSNHIKPKDLCLIPFGVAIAAQEDGWWVRSVIIWSKTNPMPASVDGWRWERHKVKIGNEGKSKASTNQGAVEAGLSGGMTNAVWQDVWQDCPGCPTCSPNCGLVLRKGSWRPTDAHEYILMLAKSRNYYCDKEAVTEPVVQSSIERAKYPFHTPYVGGRAINSRPDGSMAQFVPQAIPLSYNTKYATGEANNELGRSKTIEQEREQSRVDAVIMFPNDPEAQQEYINFIHDHHATGGRNIRSVWSFPTQPLPSQYKHFGAYPEKLPSICIKASTPEVGVCPKCGAPWARVVEENNRSRTRTGGGQDTTVGTHGRAGELRVSTLDWRPTCSCFHFGSAPAPIPARVLDPFSGAGTTAIVCEKLGRDFIGIDIASDYVAMSKARILAVKLKLESAVKLRPESAVIIDRLRNDAL